MKQNLSFPVWIFFCVFFFLSTAELLPLSAKVFDSIAIQVQNRVITKNEIELVVIQKAEERKFLRQEPLGKEDLKKLVINELINDNLVKIRADELGVRVTDEEIRNRIKEYKEKNSLNDTAFEELLKNINSSMKQFNRIQLESLKKQKTLSREVYGKINISEEDLKNLYQSENKKEVYQIRHLLRQVPIEATAEQKEKAKQEIVYFADQVKKGASFEKLAKEYSEDPSVPQNQGILEFELKNAITPLRDAIAKLKPGEYSPPVKTRFGYHLVKLLKVKQLKEQLPFEQVKNEYRQKLFQKKYEDILQKFYVSLKSRIRIVFIDSSLKKYVTTEEPSGNNF